MDNGGSLVTAWLLILLAIFLYFVPYICALSRGCKAKDGIAVVNLFLGWTFIGWVVALAWAASGEVTLTTPKLISAAEKQRSAALFHVERQP